MTTLFLTHEAFLAHDTGEGHPERPDRLRAVAKVLEHEIFKPLVRAEAPLREDAEEAILMAHPRAYLASIKAAAERAGNDGEAVYLDPDTRMSAGSYEAAMRAVGAGLTAVDKVMTGEVRNAFCAVRPPGHHAERKRPMGFCLFGSIAIAGLYARQKYAAERIAVVDFDVHHGNGTQDIFWSDKDLYLGSTHQMPLYPGSGAISEFGQGNITNAPLRPGDGGAQFREAMTNRILPALIAHRPDIVLISAGFDAHEDDPLGNLRLTEPDFAWATGHILDVADKYAKGRVVSMLEGGYNLGALARSAGVHVRALMEG